MECGGLMMPSWCSGGLKIGWVSGCSRSTTGERREEEQICKQCNVMQCATMGKSNCQCKWECILLAKCKLWKWLVYMGDAKTPSGEGQEGQGDNNNKSGRLSTAAQNPIGKEKHTRVTGTNKKRNEVS